MLTNKAERMLPVVTMCLTDYLLSCATCVKKATPGQCSDKTLRVLSKFMWITAIQSCSKVEGRLKANTNLLCEKRGNNGGERGDKEKV